MEKKNTKKKPSKKTFVAKGKRKALRGVEDLDPRITVIKETASVIPFLIKTGVILGIIYFTVRSYKKRFIRKPEISKYSMANITMAEAESRADKIAGAPGIFWGDFDTIVNAFSHPSGLNYNALVRIYNAFGNRKSTYLSGERNLTEWLTDLLDDYQLQQISALTSGVIV